MKRHITIMVILFSLICSYKCKNEDKNEQKTKSLSETNSKYELLKINKKVEKDAPVSYPLFDSYTKLYKSNLKSKMGGIDSFKLNKSIFEGILLQNSNSIARLSFIHNGSRYSIALEVNGKYFLIDEISGNFVETSAAMYSIYVGNYISKVGTLYKSPLKTLHGQTNYISFSTTNLYNEIINLQNLSFHIAQIDPNYSINETGNDSIQIKNLQDNCPYNLTLILEGEDIKNKGKVYFDANNTYPPYP